MTSRAFFRAVILAGLAFFTACSPPQATQPGAAPATPRPAAPTPTPTPQVQPCTASDLVLSAGAQGATGSIFFAVTLTNVTRESCSLQGPPDMQLVDASNRVLDIQSIPFCFSCSAPAPGGTASPAPTQIATVASILDARVEVAPLERASVLLIWSNWCEPFPAGGVKVRLALPDGLGEVDSMSNALAGGRCDAPDHGSQLMVSEYSQK